jgi:hypothetical protein
MKRALGIRSSRVGSVIALALITAAVLSVLGATSFMVLQNRYRLAHQTSRWQEALLPAEAGVDLAVNEIRKQLYLSDLSSNFFDTADGWKAGEPYFDENNNAQRDGTESFSDLNENSQWDGTGHTKTVTLASGNHPVSFTVYAEPMDPVVMNLKAGDEPYWRVRSFGTVGLSGGAVRSAGEKLDTSLRKLSLRRDRLSQRDLSAPQVTRMVEVILKPLSTFRLALFGTSTIDMTNHNIVVDSYDSRDPLKSTNGAYDPAKRQESGDIATNGKVINAGGAHIYGDAATNGGTTGENGVLDAQNVTGDVTNDFYQEVFPVNTPKIADGSTDIPPTAGTPSTVRGTMSIDATPDTVKQYRLDTITLSGSETLTITGQRDPITNAVIPTYAQIVITGDSSLSGQASIVMEEGVYVRIFVMGDADFTGNGFANPNSPLHLQVYGVDQYRRDAAGNILNDSNGQPIIDYGSIKISGNGGFMGSVYAPHYDIEMKGGGTSDSIYGAFVGHNIFMNGVQSVHYDEALSDGGLVGEYKVVSWFEDVR